MYARLYLYAFSQIYVSRTAENLLRLQMGIFPFHTP